jgi:hypothetical protein
MDVAVDDDQLDSVVSALEDDLDGAIGGGRGFLQHAATAASLSLAAAAARVQVHAASVTADLGELQLTTSDGRGAVRHAMALAKLEGLLHNLTDALALSGQARVYSSAAVASFASPRVTALTTKRFTNSSPDAPRPPPGVSRRPAARSLRDAFADAHDAASARAGASSKLTSLEPSDGQTVDPDHGRSASSMKLSGKICKLLSEVERMRGIVRQLQQRPAGSDVRDGATAEAAAAGASTASGIFQRRRVATLLR